MSSNNIEEILKEYGESKKEIVAVYLFGSYAKGKQGIDSDVDVAILSKPCKDKLRNFEIRINYQRDISLLLKKEIDIILLQEAGELLSYQIVKYGKVVFERDRDERCQFQSRRVMQYLDFQFLLNNMQNGMIASMRREASGR